jgi:hypothetical protein
MIDRKDIFMSGFKSKIGYLFTYKDLNEFEAIIDFYEQQCKKQKEVIDKAKSLNHEISHTIYEDFLEKNIIGSKFLYERIKKQFSILEIRR